MLYGGVKGGRLEEYKKLKQELEALLAEQLHSNADEEHKSPSKNDCSTPKTEKTSILPLISQRTCERSSDE